ncbi:MAG: sigma 54-interacting transcriptional regulator [Thermodesulfobacteriota bacterium]
MKGERKAGKGKEPNPETPGKTFQAFFYNSPDVMLIIDVQTRRILDANPALTNILQYEPNSIIGKHFTALYAQGLDLPMDQQLDETRVYGPVFEAQPVSRADGRVVPMDLTATLIPWGEGTGMLAVFRDVTDREEAHNALRESEYQYRTLFEKATDAILLEDGNGRILDANKAATVLFGYSREELLARNGDALLLPEGEAPASMSGDGLQTETPVEMMAIHRDGHTIPIEITSVPFSMGGQALFLRVVRNITDRKNAEAVTRRTHEELERRVKERTAELLEKNEQLESEIRARRTVEKALRSSEGRFRALFETAEDWIFLKDKQLRFTHVNPSMLRMLGLPLAEVIGKTGSELFGADEARNFTAAENRVLSGQTVELEQSFRRKDRTIACQCLMVPLKSAQGDIEGLYAIARDITERRTQECDTTTAVEATADSQWPSAAMRSVMAHIRLAAGTDSIVLLLGESGVGKDHLARLLHDSSPRSGGPFFTINCAALTPDLAESELFGHEAGAFTGSLRRKRGLLELAEGGTLLLNEVGELTLEIQAKLLTFLDTQSFTRVGGQKHISVNARLVAATNRDLAQEVKEGRFRNDLFYRLSVIVIKIPPLRERKEDIPLLVTALSRHLAKSLGLRQVPLFDSAAVEALMQYHWPGNIRELRNVMERAVIHSDKERITTGHISLDAAPQRGLTASALAYTLTVTGDSSMQDALRDAKKFLLQEGLRRSGGSVKDAAQLLGITRDSFNHHMRSLGLQRE